MAGAASLEFGMLLTQAAVASEAGTHGFPAVEGHEAAFRFAASALYGMAAFGGAAGRVGRLLFRGAVVADGTARLVMTGIAGHVAVGRMIEGYRHAGGYFAAEHDGIGRKLDFFLEVLSLCRRTPGKGCKKGEGNERSHAQSPVSEGNARRHMSTRTDSRKKV